MRWYNSSQRLCFMTIVLLACRGISGQTRWVRDRPPQLLILPEKNCNLRWLHRQLEKQVLRFAQDDNIYMTSLRFAQDDNIYMTSLRFAQDDNIYMTNLRFAQDDDI